MEINDSSLNLDEDTQKQAEVIMAKLLSCWSIPRCKSPETKLDYDFIASHQEYFDTVLRLCGHGGLKLSTASGREVAYVIGREGGLPRRFSKDESIVLLRLLQEYLRCRTKVSISGGDTDMFAGDLLEHVNVTRRIPMDEKELLKILSTLDAYHFVRLDLRKKAEFCRETILTIMPNIVCLLPYATVESIDEQLQAYTQETTKRKKPDEDQEDFGETGSNGRE